MNKEIVIFKRLVIEESMLFKELINRLTELGLLINGYELKENILVDTGIEIIHNFVDEFDLSSYRNTVNNLRYKDAVNRGLSYNDYAFFDTCLAALNNLEEMKKNDDVLNFFINNGYLNGCYVNGVLIKRKLK